MKIAQCVEAFIERKRVCGYEYEHCGRFLRRFAISVGAVEISEVTAGHINAFLSNGNLTNGVWRRYRSLIRRFFAYWVARGQVTRIPEPEQRPPMKTRFFPFVYSRAEISRLLAAAPSSQANRQCKISSSTLTTIVLFLYGTGMRVKEALAIQAADVDFRRQSVEIFPGSLYRHRTLPIGRDVQRLLHRYLRSTERTKFGLEKALFLTTAGQPVTYNRLRPSFRRLRETAGVFRPNSHLPPRLHDLRHTFAVHSITRWAQAGWSFERMLPMLTSYMGNVREKGFLRYFELTPSRYHAQLDCLDVRTSELPK